MKFLSRLFFFALVAYGASMLYSLMVPVSGFEEGSTPMNLFVKLFTITLVALGLTMLYSWYMDPIEVLEEGRTKVKSKYSDKIVSAPTRRIKKGFRTYWQVKTPGGGWYECRNGDCPETLRIEYVDHAFKRQPMSEPGSISPYNEER